MHLDIKTANVFLDRNDSIKLGDFGMARNLDNTNQFFTNFAGTPLYLPPEIINGEPYAYKADIWSLGVVLFEMMNLKVPFMDVNFPCLLLRICQADPPELPKKYSPEIKNFIYKLLEKDQSKRMNISEIFEDPFLIKLTQEYEKQHNKLPNLKRISNFRIDDFKLQEDFNNLRTNRMTVYANDANKIMREVQNAIKPSRFKGGNKDVFSSTISKDEHLDKSIVRNENGQTDKTDEESFPVRESAIMGDSEFKRLINETDFETCLKELNNPELCSQSDVESEKRSSSSVKNVFENLMGTTILNTKNSVQFKAEVMEGTLLDMNYSKNDNKSKNDKNLKNVLSDKKSKNGPNINPAFYNSYLKNSVYKANDTNLKNKFEPIDTNSNQDNQNEDLTQSEIKKKRMNEEFLNKMCKQKSDNAQNNQEKNQVSQENEQPVTKIPKIDIQKSIIKKVSTKNRFSQQTNSNKKSNFKSQGKEMSHPKTPKRNEFIIFSKKENWEKFKLCSKLIYDEGSDGFGKSSRIFKLEGLKNTNKEEKNSVFPEIVNPIMKKEISLSSIGLSKLPAVANFSKKPFPEVINEPTKNTNAEYNKIQLLKVKYEKIYEKDFCDVYSIVRKFVQFFGIRQIEKYIKDDVKLGKMALQFDQNIYAVVPEPKQFTELVFLAIAEMKYD